MFVLIDAPPYFIFFPLSGDGLFKNILDPFPPEVSTRDSSFSFYSDLRFLSPTR